MQTSTDCIPCILRQVKSYSKLLGYSKELENSLYENIKVEIGTLSKKLSPPEIAAKMSELIMAHTTITDPYWDLKRKSNKAVLEIYDKLKSLINNSADKFLKALELAIAGNIIDYGAKHDVDLVNEISKILKRCDNNLLEDSSFFDYKSFKKDFENAANILYIGDNCGEIIFDKLFIEEIIKEYPKKKITFVVRNKPILNDATYQDAKSVGLTEMVKVISSGCNTPGTVLKDASVEFLESYKQSDLIISKGQGNYESLSDIHDPRIYYLFVVKCEVVSKHVSTDIGKIILTKVLNG